MCLVDVGKLSEPVTKLMDVCSKGVGKVYEPKHIKRIKKAEADGIKALAEARAAEIEVISKKIRENPDIPIVYSDGHITIDNSNDELLVRMQNRVQFQELKKQQNIENVIAAAYLQLKDETEVSQEKVDEDWINRFFNSVGEISNEDMQYIWGRILSGEIKKPGSYSIRTLEALRSLSKDEAELFRKMSSLLMKIGNEFFIYCDKDINKTEYLKIYDIVRMTDAGLISSDRLSLPLKIVNDINKNPIIIYQSKVILFEKETDGVTELTIPLYKMTKAGGELSTITEKSLRLNYLKQIASQIKKPGIKLFYSEIININDSEVEYDDEKVEL